MADNGLFSSWLMLADSWPNTANFADCISSFCVERRADSALCLSYISACNADVLCITLYSRRCLDFASDKACS